MYKYKSLQAGQLPQEHLSFLQNLLNFIVTKYLKQEVDSNISICVDKHNPCGLPITGDLSVSHDLMVMALGLYGLLSRSCFYWLDLITVAPL